MNKLRQFTEAYLAALIFILIATVALVFVVGPIVVANRSGNPLYLLLELFTIPLLYAIGEML